MEKKLREKEYYSLERITYLKQNGQEQNEWCAVATSHFFEIIPWKCREETLNDLTYEQRNATVELYFFALSMIKIGKLSLCYNQEVSDLHKFELK